MNDPGSWEESEPHDHARQDPEFDRIVKASGFRFHVYDALQDDYRLTPAEAARATNDYLTGRTTDPSTPGKGCGHRCRRCVRIVGDDCRSGHCGATGGRPTNQRD